MSEMQVLVFGRGSFLAREFAARHADLGLRVLGHGEADDAERYEGARCVVNFAFAPELHHGPYDASLDVDARVARHAARTGMHYVMMSSRRVYPERAQWNASESTEISGIDVYGRNKALIERSLQAMLGERLTILRPGNVVGYEPIPGRERFGAYLQNQLLQTGRIRLTVNPAVRRDLVPVEFFCRVVREVVTRRPSGIFNIGAGRATAVGDAARWLVEGFGSGELVLGSERIEGEFLLDTARMKSAFNLACGEDDVQHMLRDVGRRLATEGARRARTR